MTIEEAIRILDPKTSRDELIPYAYDPDFRLHIVDEACRVVCAALRTQQEAERNDPLTLEELREMDGEPVWCEILVKGHRSLFGIVHGDTVTGYVPGETHATTFKTNEVGGYGLAWLAYRRKPEEV